MRQVYDNGYKILGQVNYIIEYLKENIENVYEKDSEEYNESYENIKDLQDNYNKNDIIVYNYDSGMGAFVQEVWNQDTDLLEYYKDLEKEE